LRLKNLLVELKHQFTEPMHVIPLNCGFIDGKSLLIFLYRSGQMYNDVTKRN